MPHPWTPLARQIFPLGRLTEKQERVAGLTFRPSGKSENHFVECTTTNSGKPVTISRTTIVGHITSSDG